MIHLPLASAMQGLFGLYNRTYARVGVNSNPDFLLLSPLYHGQLLNSSSFFFFRMVSHVVHRLHCPRFKSHGEMLHNFASIDGWSVFFHSSNPCYIVCSLQWNHGEEFEPRCDSTFYRLTTLTADDNRGIPHMFSLLICDSLTGV